MLKVAAALSGQVAFRPLKDHTGRVEVEYVTGSRGAAARELVTDIPPILLPAILNLVASDTDPVITSFPPGDFEESHVITPPDAIHCPMIKLVNPRPGQLWAEVSLLALCR